MKNSLIKKVLLVYFYFLESKRTVRTHCNWQGQGGKRPGEEMVKGNQRRRQCDRGRLYGLYQNGVSNRGPTRKTDLIRGFLLGKRESSTWVQSGRTFPKETGGINFTKGVEGLCCVHCVCLMYVIHTCVPVCVCSSFRFEERERKYKCMKNYGRF